MIESRTHSSGIWWRFQRNRGTRLEQFALTLPPQGTRVLQFGRFAHSWARA